MKWFVKIPISLVVALGVLSLSYVAYVFIDYHRIGSMPIEAQGEASQVLKTGESYDIESWNIGFGAYTADYDFFMDGGKQSWAESPERLDSNLADISARLAEQNADLYLIQEVDIDATRSYHRDEREPIIDAIGENRSYTFAQNYDSPFLFYPFKQPHGASKAGIMTFSNFPITSAERVELPVEKGFTKLLDLDRCYSVNRIPTADGKELCLYNLHLSAYTSDGTIANEQLKILLSDMQENYENGCYCIAGGDFNKDILGDSSVYFGKSDKEYTWAQPIPEGTFDGLNVSLVAPLDEANPVPSCRNPDSAYHEGQYVLTVDGFLVSDNVKVESSEVIDYTFAYSDHNPVKMTFTLNP